MRLEWHVQVRKIIINYIWKLLKVRLPYTSPTSRVWKAGEIWVYRMYMPQCIFIFLYIFISNQNLQIYELICWRKSCDAQCIFMNHKCNMVRIKQAAARLTTQLMGEIWEYLIIIKQAAEHLKVTCTCTSLVTRVTDCIRIPVRQESPASLLPTIIRRQKQSRRDQLVTDYETTALKRAHLSG
jgi:hypothetical protein